MSNKDSWFIYYNEAKEFYKENNHLNITYTYVSKNSNIKLGNWVGRMRNLNKQGLLSTEKQELLDKIGMIWDIKKLKDEEQFNNWMNYFNEVKQYFNNNQNAKLQANYIQNGLNIGSWFISQKLKYRNNDLGYKSKEKKVLLKSLNVSLDKVDTLKMLKDNHEYSWLRNYRALLTYYKENNTLIMPKNYIYTFLDGTSINLKDWFYKQIKLYSKDLLSSEQKELLDKLNIKDYLFNKKNTITWEEHYQLLKEYYDKNNTLKMLSNYQVKYNGEYYNLGLWFKRQCSRYSLDRLTLKQVKLLKKLNIDDYLKPSKTIPWITYYRVLLNYYNIHHNIVIPINYTTIYEEETIKLGEYLNNIRTKKIRLTNEQINLLNRLSMIWDIDLFNKKLYELTWINTFNALKECIALYGSNAINSNITITILGNKVNLTEWFNMQKKLLNLGILNNEQINKINEFNLTKKTRV